MELLALNKPITNPRKLIDKWTSLVWTLRYNEPGEFKLETPLIEKTIADLPLGSFVTINEGDEIMMVENYEITQNEDGKDVLIVSGRSLMSFLEYRTALDEYALYHDYSTDLEAKQVEGDVHAWLIKPPGPANDADIAAFIMYRHLVEGVFNSPDNAIRPEVIPNLSIVQLDATNRRPYIRYIERGNLLNAVQAILLAGNNGFKSKRAIGAAMNTEFIVYKGLDRTRGQSTNAPMILRHDQGHILSPRYLMSIKGYYNSFRIFPTRWPMFTDTVWGPDNTSLAEPDRMGWGYRELLIDATEITSDDQSVVDPAMMQRLYTEIAKNLPTQILECTVAENIPYVFGVNYNLGDLCTVMGDFNIVENAQITEYVKVEDALGERSSPGLKIIQ